jgi:hypothetical protein
VVCCALTTGQPAPAASQVAEITSRLELGTAIDREISGWQQHVYELALKAGEYAGVIVEQRGIDIVLSVRDSTTDPGRAMITGKWADIGRFKGPILRALASRAPYFHNGFAASLEAVVDFYESRFGIGLTVQEKADLVAFLRAL